MGRRRRSSFHGVLVVDKPVGPTSHDVVARVRRAFGTRVVGHSGTLDPMASGVLVVAIGEATKLVPYLTADDKRYVTTVRLGFETTSLDAAGEPTERAAVPSLSITEWQRLADTFLGEGQQQVPHVSAIRVDGERLYERARRGEVFEPPTRGVVVHQLHILRAAADVVEARLHCGKGFYVRSWGRDLARLAGTRGHLTALRREASGSFSLDEAVSVPELEQAVSDEAVREAVHARLLPLAAACERVLTPVRVSEEGALHAFHGRPVPLEACDTVPDMGTSLCLLSAADGTALAIARREASGILIVRGFCPDAEPSLAKALPSPAS